MPTITDIILFMESRDYVLYDFAGFLQRVTDDNGKNIKVDEEGTVSKSSTRETAKRAGIGAGAGAILGAILGGAKGAVIGATIGAGAAFLLSRYVARDWVLRKFATNARFRAIDDAVAADGWKIVGLIRLSPVFPFIPMNFVFGLTRIPFWHFFFTTWVAILPVSSLFVYLGTMRGDIAALGTHPIAAGKTKWIVSGVGIVTTAIVSIIISRIARKALINKISDEEE